MIAAGFLLVLLIILFRIPAVRLSLGKKIPKPELSVMSVMSPKGLIPAVLASIPLQRGLAHGEVILDLGYSIVLFSIIITSTLVVILSLNPNYFEERISKLRKRGKITVSDSSDKQKNPL